MNTMSSSHYFCMRKKQKYSELTKTSSKPSGEEERLQLFMDRLERIQADVDFLMSAMDQAFLELSARKSKLQDFLTNTDKAANE